MSHLSPTDAANLHRKINSAHRAMVERAVETGECLASPAGWCYAHSTGEGPVYCEAGQ